MFQRDEITEEELNSQVELLRDDEILRTVVQAPGLAGASLVRTFSRRERGSRGWLEQCGGWRGG